MTENFGRNDRRRGFLPPQKEESHAAPGRRSEGRPLLLRCRLVCGNGNVRGPVQGAVTRSGMTSFVRRR